MGAHLVMRGAGVDGVVGDLKIQSYDLTEAISRCFTLSVTAVSSEDDLDLDEVVGSSFELGFGALDATLTQRKLRAVCLSAEQLGDRRKSGATYRLELGPRLALLEHRSPYRVFQHRSAPAIAASILADWGIPAEFVLDDERYPALEYRVQYGESDLAFLSRILEESGIAFTFPADRDDVEIVLFDEHRDLGTTTSLRYVDVLSNGSDADAVANVRVGRRLKTGRVVARDVHFRLDSRASLRAESSIEGRERFERHEFLRGASARLSDGPGTTPVADAKGAALPLLKVLQDKARHSLERDEARRREVSFDARSTGLATGADVLIVGHPREELREGTLRIIELRTRGTSDTDGTDMIVEARALFTDVPFRPLLATRKPRALGIQSAIVVGPEGEAIHTDEFGRVKVQFPWDDEGANDETSSCWLRASQSWAGAGHASFTLPRVGDEVLVAFFDGDPDQPVIVGALHNASHPVPFALPANKAVSTWRSASVPANGGFNEIRFEDAAGSELVAVQAERDLVTVVKQSATMQIGSSRKTHVVTTDDCIVGERHSVVIDSGDRITKIETTPSKVTVTTGEATIVLDGANISFDTPGEFVVRAGGNIRIESTAGEVVVQGGPMVRINPHGAGEHPASNPSVVPFALPTGESQAAFDDVMSGVASRGWFDADRPTYFDELVAPNGPFDPTPRGEADDPVRAFKYAVAAKCLGYPEGVILRRAGRLNQARHGRSSGEGDPGNGVFGGTAPYGNSPSQADAIAKGFAYHRASYGE